MKILIISTMQGAPWGGSEELWLKLSTTAQQHHEVLVSLIDWKDKISPKVVSILNSGIKVNFRQNPVELQSLSYFQKIKYKFRLLIRQKSPYDKILKFNPDTILVSQGSSAEIFHEPGLIKLLIELADNIPVNIVTHSFNENDYNKSEIAGSMKLLYQRSSNLFFISKKQVLDIQNALGIIFPKVEITQNPINLLNFNQLEYPDSETLLMATVSSLTIKWKGQDLLIEALADPKWTERNWRLNIYGTGPDERLLKNLVDKYNLKEKIKFHGQTEDIQKVWVQNQILITPSRQDIVPLSMIEAMVCARPVAATPVGGIPEWIEEGYNGFLSEEISLDSIINMLERVWNNKGNLKHLGLNAHHIINKMDQNPALTLLNKITNIHAA